MLSQSQFLQTQLQYSKSYWEILYQWEIHQNFVLLFWSWFFCLVRVMSYHRCGPEPTSRWQIILEVQFLRFIANPKMMIWGFTWWLPKQITTFHFSQIYGKQHCSSAASNGTIRSSSLIYLMLREIKMTVINLTGLSNLIAHARLVNKLNVFHGNDLIIYDCDDKYIKMFFTNKIKNV